MSSSKRILDVGQCGFDGPRIGAFLMREFNCAVDRAHSKDQALELAAAQAYDLVLVNRILAADRSQGLEVIAALRTAHPELRLMLISDIAEAQDQAVDIGALRGFGKSELASTSTEQLLRTILNS